VEVDKYLINSLIMMGVNLIIALLIVTILAIRISHRLMGPVPRLKRNLEAIANGDLTKKIVFRDKDELKPILEEDFNGMLDSFSEKIQKMDANTRAIHDLIQNEDEISGEKLMKVQKELKEITSVLNGFQYNK
jgi:methyl-accepting chemotaxis protein